jgi:hypothetical protein
MEPQVVSWEQDQAASYEFASAQSETYAFCLYAQKTGDFTYPVLCLKDGRYAPRNHCPRCSKRKDHSDA